MKFFSGGPFSYQIISHVTPAETKVCVAVVFYMHVYSTVVASGSHAVLFFASAVEELNL